MEGQEGGDPAELSQGSAVQALVGVCASNALPRVSATASSVENGSLGPNLAIDGNPATRWSSSFADPQWLRVDLGAISLVRRVKINWETAASKAYTVEVSDDDVTWRAVFSTSNASSGAGPTDIPGLEARARFVRVNSTERATPWGNSIYELEVFGDQNPNCGTPSDNAFDIQSVNSGRSIDVKDHSVVDGGAIQQWGYGGGFNQRWVPVPQGNGEFLLKSMLHSGKCLDVNGWSTANGASIIQWGCHGGANQRFRINSAGNGQFTLQNVNSGKCVDVAGWSTADGAPIIQWDCHGGANQRWRFNRVSGVRKWATRDANSSGTWNWSTTSASGGDTVGADSNGDLYASSGIVSFSFTHNGTGYAEGNLTTGYSAEGLEAGSQAERDAGKAVNPKGRLSFRYMGYTSRDPSKINQSRMKLVDAWGNVSNSVRVIDYINHCAMNDCDADIPLSAFATNAFDFQNVRSITAFVDSTVPGATGGGSGYYFFSMGNVEFIPDSEAIDLSSDPDNCGSAGYSCLGGACRDGYCEAKQFGDELFCSAQNAMAVDGNQVFIGDSVPAGTGVIYRYNLDGSNKTTLVSSADYPQNFLRKDATLYYSTYNAVIARPDSGAAIQLAGSNTTSLLGITGSKLISYAYNFDPNTNTTTSGFYKLDRVVPNSSSLIADTSGVYPSYTALTDQGIYYNFTKTDGTAQLARINLSNGTSNTFSLGSGYVQAMVGSPDAVYWSFSENGATGIRRLREGGSIETLISVAQPNGISGVFVDSTDPSNPQLYYPLWDGTTTSFVRSPVSNTAIRTTISTSRFPYQSTRIFFTPDSVIWHESCYKYTGGSVHRLRK